VVIGAGPAGLAVAHALERAGIAPRVLERRDRVASSWYAHYEGLRLNSPRRLSSLPGMPMDRRLGRWVSRADFLDYLREYAGRLSVEPELGVDVRHIDRDARGWLLDTSAGEVAASAVVVATGLNRTAFVPDWPGRETFRGELVHVAGYRRPEPYLDRDVLVVGTGASGVDVAMELVRAGCRRVRISVRTPPLIFRRHAWTALLSQAIKWTPLPGPVVDRGSLVVHRLMWGDLEPFGLGNPREGLVSSLRGRGHGATIDRGLVSAVKAGAIQAVPAVEAFDGAEVRLAGGERIAPDVVIAATGQRADLGSLVGHLGVLDGNGRPAVHGARTADSAPGLHFVGYRLPAGQLPDLGPDARAVARSLARSRAAGPPPRPR
jgi:cation diffusion facilitator CzcD-associated flavoprotein CzcO